MLDRVFGFNVHAQVQTFGLCILAIGIPLNKVVMSSAMVFLALNFVLEGDYKAKITRLFSSTPFLLITAFFLLHLIGLIWTTNFDYAWHDIRVKLPFFIVPLILIAQPIKIKKHLYYVLIAFIVSTVITSLINIVLYQDWLDSHESVDIRELSFFGSHIRYALIITMCIAISFYFLRYKKFRWINIVLIGWFAFYTFYSQVISGVLTLVAISSFYGIYLIWTKWKVFAILSSAILLSAFVGILYWIFTPITIDINDYQNLPVTTIEGNEYTHEFDMVTPETREPTHIYICEKELARDWPNYSSLPYEGLDLKGQPLKKTIIRFLSSKQLRKDAEGLSQLTPKEIRDIELGKASTISNGIMARIYGLQYQLNNAQSPNNHSLLERIEYWKTGGSIFKENWIIGVGTGDVQDAFNKTYEEQNSLLEVENRHRAHNMFLTVAISFGVVGLILFCWMLYSFLSFNIKQEQLLGVLFMVICIVSFLPEDTLETQTGVTFFGLFYGLFAQKTPEA